VAPGERELHDLVAALAAVPVSGVVLLEVEGQPAGSGVLDAADAALASAGIRGLRVAGTDVGALERSLVGFIVARGAEIERQAALLEAELRRRALDGGGVAALIPTVSAFLGRALAVEARRGETIVVHAPLEAPSAAADAARYQARPRDRAATALRVPLPSAGGDDGAAAGPPWLVVLARQREPGGEDDAPAARETREAARRAIRLLAPARRLNLRGDADSLEIRLVVAGTVEETDRLVEQVGVTLGRTVALSNRFGVPADRAAAEAEARSTLEAALELDRPPAIARADRLPVYRMLGALHKLPDGARLSAALLAPLLDARPDVRRERVQTLRALLGHGGVGEAAAALGVHRNTVAYRLRRIEAETGWRLADPELRLPLTAALELVHDEQV
jgi:hypothetical protein